MANLIGVKQLAKILKVKPETIRTWHRLGLIPGLRVSTRPILFDEAEVLAALRERRQERLDNG